MSGPGQPNLSAGELRSPPCEGSSIARIDVHTRKLRLFLAVADELHFSRAAARVFLTQQALSRQIRELEDELGVQLFERTTRRVALTPAGEAFYETAKSIVSEFDEVVTIVRRMNRALSGRLRLGFCPGAALELTVPILDMFRDTFPDVVLEMREFPVTEPSAGLASGDTDVAFIRLPQGTQRIQTEPLFVDPVIAAVAESHPLAAKESVSVQDLLPEPLTLSNTSDEVYREFWGLQRARTELTAPRFVPVSSVTEEESLVAAGVAVAMTSAAVEKFAPAPGVRYLDITDWPGSTVALGWHLPEPSEVVARFIDVACAVRDRERSLIDRIEGRSPRTGSQRVASAPAEDAD